MHILFLCVANSARSQMAEGMARKMAPEGVTVSSAGSRPTKINKLAVDAMREVGVFMGEHRSKRVDEFRNVDVDLIITLCKDEVCPVYLSEVERLAWPVEDPAGYESETWEEQRARFVIAREEIREKLKEFFKRMEEEANAGEEGESV